MADRRNSAAPDRAPLQNSTGFAAIKPDRSAQFQARGYVIDESSEMMLRDLFAAMEATALAYDMDQGGTANFDLTGDQVAAVIRSWARLGKHLIGNAPFAIQAMVRNRDC